MVSKLLLIEVFQPEMCVSTRLGGDEVVVWVVLSSLCKKSLNNLGRLSL